MMPNSIQSREYSTDSGTGGISYITDSDGNPNVFNVKCNDDGTRWLNANWVNPDNEWNLDNEIVFRLRNSLHFSPVSASVRGSFVFVAVLASRQAFCLCHPVALKGRYIFCLAVILFPTKS